MSLKGSSLSSYVLKRIAQSVPLVLGVIVVNFCIMHLAPGDPMAILVGELGASNPEYVRIMRSRLGLDKPLHEQLIIYILRLASGDLGYSMIFNRPVLDLIVSRLPLTVLLVGSAIVLATILGSLLGVLSSKKPYSVVDNLTMAVSSIGFSIPVFWLGQILIISLSFNLGLFPVQGWLSIRDPPSGLAFVTDVLWHLALPVTALGVQYLALIARISRSSMIEQLRQNYITTARAKGLPEDKVFYKHALRNALIAIVTITGIHFGYMLAGAVVTETVFAWPGLGRLTFEATFSRDYPIVTGVFIFIALTTIVANLVVDVVYERLDPRIRY